jgi:hypothetical protein
VESIPPAKMLCNDDDDDDDDERYRINFKIILLVFKTLMGKAPQLIMI